MPLKKMCLGCGKLIDYDMYRCPECAKKVEEKIKQRHKEYKRNRQDIKEQKFYTSKPWIITRETIKTRDKGLCKVCLSKNIITFMNTVHHIEELKDCWDKRLVPSNLISLCESCHQMVHNRYKTEKGKTQKELRAINENL